MEKRAKITADSTCDLSRELLERFDITLLPLFVTMGDVSYRDGVDIIPGDVFDYVERTGELPKTAAVSVEDYYRVFKEYTDRGISVIHICIGAGFSACYQSASLVAQQLGNVYVVDSRNLSTGSGHLVMAAAEMAEKGMEPQEILRELEGMIPRVETSFLIERLDYLAKGGRCSSVAALGANLLKLRPCIEVQDGSMHAAKKYRGPYAKCIEQYVSDKLKDRGDICQKRVFITYPPYDSPAYREAVRRAVEKYGRFDEIIETDAGCTISTHCGPNTFGVVFVRK